ncbi:MAG: ABC transporter ATP-binding protein [Muribaculaceae bacterium]
MINLSEIRKSFDSIDVLKGVNLSINDKEVAAIVGPSGAGKTTLLQIIGSLEKPDSGKVTYGDTDIFALKPDELARFRNQNIGFVFQFHQLLPEFSLLENVMMPALIKGTSLPSAEKDAKELIEYLGLTSRLSHKPAELSGGERQRAAVARSLINKPQIVLADEPSGSLDSANRNDLHKLFFDLRNDIGQTFVIVTHDENFAADADRIIHINDGLITSITSNK